MVTPFSILCQLLMVDTLLGLDSKQAQIYRQEEGKFINAPEVTLTARSSMACAARCTAMELWFCGGFTYRNSGVCHLYRGNKEAVCVNPLSAVPGLVVDKGSGPRSYRRLQASCPGKKIYTLVRSRQGTRHCKILQIIFVMFGRHICQAFLSC